MARSPLPRDLPALKPDWWTRSLEWSQNGQRDLSDVSAPFSVSSGMTVILLPSFRQPEGGSWDKSRKRFRRRIVRRLASYLFRQVGCSSKSKSDLHLSMADVGESGGLTLANQVAGVTFLLGGFVFGIAMYRGGIVARGRPCCFRSARWRRWRPQRCLIPYSARPPSRRRLRSWDSATRCGGRRTRHPYPHRRFSLREWIPPVSETVRQMDVRKISKIFGIVFLLTWVTAIAARMLLDPVYSDARYILGDGVSAGVYVGAVFEFLLIATNVTPIM